MKVKEENYSKGKVGETVAEKYLMGLGYKPILKNYLNKLGEVDLIMADGGWLVFVEVKYKSDDSLGTPEEMINYLKIRQIRRVAESFLIEKQEGFGFEKYRIDAVCILGSKVRHYKNIE